MQPLIDVQAGVARAVLTGEVEPIAAALVGGSDPRTRLGIHARHYAASLTAALCQKFPATMWLVGDDVMTAAARGYTRARPPTKPCIAEYGRDFPDFLAAFGPVAALPYVRPFAELERAIADVSIEIDLAPLSWPDVVCIGSQRLLDLSFVMQPGLRYLRLSWSVDELLSLYLEDSEPERFALSERDSFVEVRGARGAVSMTRLDEATFAFRSALRAGRSVAAAAEDALGRDPAFDAGAALFQLTQMGLVSRVSQPVEGDGS